MTITENQRLRNRAFGVILFLAAALLQEQGNAQDSCASNLSGLTNISFSTSSLRCIKAWPQYNYILRHSVDNSTKIVSIVFSSDIDDSYHAIGFSRNGKMVPSSAIVGWSSNKIPVIKAYSLQGQSPDLVLPDSTMLKLVKGSPKAFIQNGALYLTFQVQLDQLSTHLIYAIGPLNTLPGSGYKLQEHRDFLSTKFDFTTGIGSALSIANVRRNHGAVNIVGWGILLPLGAITARYFRKFDPVWFYLHVAFQTTGYIFTTAGLALGFSLVHKGSLVNYDRHRAIGIFVFVVVFLQIILASVLRPKKEAKIRKYWNWYHRFVGGLAIILGIVNIYVGINISNAGNNWKVGYGIALAILLAVSLSLEASVWYKWLKQPAMYPYQRNPQFQMQSFA
ncbi:hypothetical protein O6H91_05G114200 [Diphasiastrum complanatum]|uniref:Uncharacterized protein n=1 Tax=Diphasiastrum complanatum TaxID=34168 RepID=A0ACC2DSH9_DIPCM|nr:hypothetical protein O6H91_05G114200 [Diphasiastrum complanatum]